MLNKIKLYSIALVLVAAILMLVSAADAAPFTYITKDSNTDSVINTDSIIDTATNAFITTMNVGDDLWKVAITPDGSKVYLTTDDNKNVSVIDTAKNAVTAMLNAGKYPIGVAFTQMERKYNSANRLDKNVPVINAGNSTVMATVNLGWNPYNLGQLVGKLTPTIYWNNPSNITYGTALNNTQLDAYASVNGNFVYTPPTGTVLSAGQQQILSITFTPTDTVNYTQAYSTALINVTRATPIITWSNPADIVHGTPVSRVQLDANASLNGTFIYNPPLGTVLNEGIQTLHVDFTPDDAINYTAVSSNVAINVLTPVQKIHQMITFVQGLVVSGEWNRQSGVEFVSELHDAVGDLIKGYTNLAIVELKNFIH
jgi:YVTN family beta-propeller protein